MWYVRLAGSFEYFRTLRPLTEYHLEFLSLKGGCTGLFDSIHVKIQHGWKSHIATQIYHIKRNILIATSSLLHSTD